MRPTGGRLVRRGPDSWELVATFGKVGGRYPTRTRRFHGTKREAGMALASWLAELELSAGNPLFADYADEWHGRRERSGAYSPRTMDREAWRLVGLKMHLGGTRVADMTAGDVAECWSRLMAGDSPSGRELKPWTIDSMHTTLAKLMSDARAEGIAAGRPEDAPRPRVTDRDGRTPTTAEVDAMLGALDVSDPRHLAVALCACLGLRRSEAVAVTWEDFDGSRVRVARSLADDGSVLPTKTGKSREVPVPRWLAERLDAMRSEGSMCAMRPPALSRWWRRNRRKWGMDGVRLHDLRHAYATRLAEAGVHPRAMMALGGWETVDVCMRIYTHVSDSALDAAVDGAFRRENRRETPRNDRESSVDGSDGASV